MNTEATTTPEAPQSSPLIPSTGGERKPITVSPAQALGLAHSPSEELAIIAGEKTPEKLEKKAKVIPAETAKNPKAEKKPVEDEKPEEEEKIGKTEEKPEKPKAKKPEVKVIPAKEDATAKELEALKKELAEIKAAQQKPKEQEQPQQQPEVAPTAEEIAAKDNAWIESRLKESDSTPFDLTAEEWDVVLDGGKDAAKLMTQKLKTAAAHSELNARKWVAEQLQGFASYVQELEQRLSPALQQHQTVQQYIESQRIYTLHPDLKGQEEWVGRVKNAMENSSNPQIREAYFAASADDRANMIASQIKQLAEQAQALAKIGQPAQQQQAPMVPEQPKPVEPPKPKAPAIPPPPAQAPGAAAPGKQVNEQARLAQSLR